MASQASWQTGRFSSHRAAPFPEGPMDQQSVEGLLRRLVERVEESERHYSEALDDLHARLDQLSQTTDAARATGLPEHAETFDRLHNHVSSLARRLEGEASTPLDDFERLGRALAGDLAYAGATPDLLDALAAPSAQLGDLPVAGGPFSSATPQTNYSDPLPPEHRDLDKRLVEMAQRLEHSIGAAMQPQALEALNARLDEIGNQIARALDEAPKGKSLDQVENQISEMAQQLGRAEAQLAKIGEIESALHKLIERVDASPAQLEEIANKAASEGARLVAGEAQLSAGAAERLDAMHRDLVAMSDRTRASDDRLSSIIEAVHESLKQLAQQVERSASQLSAPKPRAPFADRMRDLAPLPGIVAQQAIAEQRVERGEAAKAGDAGASAMDDRPKNRIEAAISDLEETEAAPHFGRAKRGQPDERASDIDTPAPGEGTTGKQADTDYEIPDDLVAAARRAAQAAALKVEERSSGSQVRWVSTDAAASLGAELPSRRKRSFLIICAAVLLAISAILLYGRLRSKPEPEMNPPTAEQSAPVPTGPSQATPAPGAEESVPAAVEPGVETPPVPSSGSSELQPEPEASAADNAQSGAGQTGNFTEIAKSSYRKAAADETMPRAQPASLKPTETAALPPGIVFALEDPALAAPAGPSVPSSIPASLPLPPPDLGPLPLRQAAAEGDARAQYTIALRYAQGQGTPQNLTEARHWLERAASAGLAPAQYRLAAMYERGLGTAKDLGRARSWYQAAAEKGNVKAMHNLAVIASGREDGADYALAAKWYGEAAAYGLADSQFNLGILAEHGLGAPANLPEAYKWFALAASGGDQEAAKRREMVKLKLDPASLAQAEQAVEACTVKDAIPEANDVTEAQEWADASPASNMSLVTRTQGLLNKLGYDTGVPDGLMGDRTREAIKSFERRNGLEETGQITIPLVTKLERLTS